MRLSTIKPLPRFKHDGLTVGKGWTEFPELDEKQRACLRDYHGRFIQVHPHDVAQLADFGLAMDGRTKPLVESGAVKPATEKKKPGRPKKNTGEQTPAE